jgi:hypothetical protein
MRKQNDKDNEGITTMYVNWKPIHTQVVLDKISGMTIDQVAAKNGFNYSTIANIMRTRNAKQIMKSVEQTILNDGVADLPEAIKRIKIKAFKAMESFIDNEEFQQKSPFAFFDRAVKAVEVMSRIESPIVPVGNTNNTNVQLNIFDNSAHITALTSGLDKALEVSKMYDNLLPESVDGSATNFEREQRIRQDSREARTREDSSITPEV